MTPTEAPTPTTVPARALRHGDVLVTGGTVTDGPTNHPTGWTKVEVDYAVELSWPSDAPIDVHRDGCATCDEVGVCHTHAVWNEGDDDAR
jgi:hypothetical protein